MENKLAQKVKELKDIHLSGAETKLGEYTSYSLYDTTEKISAYLQSRHTSSPKDSQGRDKPFANIVTSAVQTRYRATDIDRKHISIKSAKSGKVIPAFLLNVILKEWMRKSNFGIFLNKWGMALAQYGSSVVKFTKANGKLEANVVPWNRLIVDPEDINQAPVIEFYNLTEGDLRTRGYKKDVIDSLIDARTTRLTKGGEVVDNNKDFFRVYEVHGLMEQSYLTDNEDDKDFVQQMHVLCFEKNSNGDEAPFTLYRGKEERSPYKLTHLIPEDGRTLSIGTVEQLFDAQWLVNHNSKLIMDALEISSKWLVQTTDKRFAGSNSLDFNSGTILSVEKGGELTAVNNQSVNTVPIQNSTQFWQSLGNNIVGVSEAMMGEVKSGAAWRQTEAILQEAHSLFELMIENKALQLEEMIKEFVLPEIKKELDTEDEILAILDSQMVDKIDRMFIPNKAAKLANEKVLKNFLKNADKLSIDEMQTMEQPDVATEESAIRKEMMNLGNQRFFKPSELGGTTWKELFKDIDEQVIIDILGEQLDTQNNITTLTTVMQTIAGNPAVLQDKNALLIFNKILEMTGAVSPLEISANVSQANVQPQTQPLPPMAT